MSSASGQVLALFLTPFGAGIPAGVILAQKLGVAWPLTAFLYFVSDVILALVFEPLMHLFLHQSRRSPRLMLFRQSFKQSLQLLTRHYGIRPGPLTLVILTFGTDPMTGRLISRWAGHGFFTGWILTIAGDMIFFAVVMVSTLWLNSILGDGTVTAIIITVLMLGVPVLFRKWRNRVGK